MRWRRPEARAAGVQRPRGGAADGGRECTEGSPWCTAPSSRICLKRGEGDETTSGASWAAAESSRERDAVAAARLMRRRHLPANQERARGGRTAHGTPSAAQSGGATGASAPPAARRVRDGTGARLIPALLLDGSDADATTWTATADCYRLPLPSRHHPGHRVRRRQRPSRPVGPSTRCGASRERALPVSTAMDGRAAGLQRVENQTNDKAPPASWNV